MNDVLGDEFERFIPLANGVVEAEDEDEDGCDEDKDGAELKAKEEEEEEEEEEGDDPIGTDPGGLAKTP